MGAANAVSAKPQAVAEARPPRGACGCRHRTRGECTTCANIRRFSRFGSDGKSTLRDPMSTVRDVLRSPGRPLDAPTRTDMEARFGRDFGPVRVHTDQRAAASAAALGALAHTAGSAIVFANGAYAPTSANDTLGRLAQRAGARFNDWKCIKPVSMRTSTLKTPPANFNDRYELYVQNGDTFDISNLTAATGTTLRLYLFDDSSEAMDAALARLFYPGATSSLGPDVDMDSGAGSGSTPIVDLVVFGHAGGDRMWGGASTFRPSDNDSEQPAQTHTLARVGLFPRRCWFTRNARVRLVGCNSDTVGRDFATHYLRKGAEVVTTTSSVRPKCRGPLYDAATNTCTGYNGVDFADGPTPVATMLDGPFWSVGDFHGGRFWTTIKGAP